MANIFNKIIRTVFFMVLIGLIVLTGFKLAMKMIYPMEYKNYIYKYSQKYNVDPYLVAAIINVESNFEREACSKKDARGLMQIAPTTGKWAAKELDLKGFTLESLYNPETNIMIGSWYLNVLTEEFDENLQLILAAYNGGSGNVNKWLKDSEYSEDGKSLKNIPFKETNDYIVKVSDNYEKYEKVYRGTFERKEYLEESFLDMTANTFKRIFKKLLKSI